MILDLDGRRFRPVANSEGGRVQSDAVFTFSQTDNTFSATYSGAGFTDGHLIGNMRDDQTAQLVYHCRASDGALEAGEAQAQFIVSESAPIRIEMAWRWLNGSEENGTSTYEEIL